MEPLRIQLKTLTPLWTGGVDGQCDRLYETGLIGSLRWWYEALVRGLGGQACDPTGNDRCPDAKGRRCAACELFGCTGWARKFRLQVLDHAEQPIQGALGRNADFLLQFIELRPMSPEERYLLVKAVETATKYGTLGGRTTLKPQRKASAGKDYGLVKLVALPEIPQSNIRMYLQAGHWRPVSTHLPDMRWFFFVQGAFLWRRQINTLIGLSENGRRPVGQKAYQGFLRGRRGSRNRPAVSKKVFSFRSDGGRVWGYARDRKMRDTIIKEIEQQLRKKKFTVKTGEEVLSEL